MRTLIIGGTGRISTAITRLLAERGHDLTLYNRGNRPPPTDLPVAQIHGDRRAYDDFEAQMRQAGPFDCVIEMICFTPDDARSLVRAFRGSAGHVIFTSTVDVYSNPAPAYPYTEGTSREGALGGYGQNKVKCEDILFEADERGDFPVTIIRPAQTYGEGGGLVHIFGWETRFLDRMRRGMPIIVHGDGSSLWVACHRDDAAVAFANAAGNEAAFGRAYHVTGEEWMTWDRYHQAIAEGMGWPAPEIVHIPTDLLLKADPERSGWLGINFQFNNIFDNAAAHHDLDFEYTIPWFEGSRRTIEWLEEHDAIDSADGDPAYDRIIKAWRRLGRAMLDELSD
ncbi:MAG: NAD-dependent epimerase/dehydratase family protein [Candidatus Brocadiia bacterium]